MFQVCTCYPLICFRRSFIFFLTAQFIFPFLLSKSILFLALCQLFLYIYIYIYFFFLLSWFPFVLSSLLLVFYMYPLYQFFNTLLSKKIMKPYDQHIAYTSKYSPINIDIVDCIPNQCFFKT